MIELFADARLGVVWVLLPEKAAFHGKTRSCLSGFLCFFAAGLLREKISNALAGARPCFIEGVRVDVQRRCNRGMSEVCRHGLCVRAAADLQACIQMPERMNAVKWLVGALAEALEPVIRGVRVHRLTIYAREQAPAATPLIADRKPVLSLRNLVRAQHFKHNRVQLERSAAACGFRRVGVYPVFAVVL